MLNRALRLARVFHDMTQKDLAVQLGITNSHLSEIESGKKQPSMALLQRYSEVFDIPVSSLLFFGENIEDSERGVKVKAQISDKVLRLLEFVADSVNS
jgi:transcriptional regulator with XRE-family HTH domain